MTVNIRRGQGTQKMVAVYAESCTGCGYCQMACSFVKTKAFNPAKSLIKLHRMDGKERFSISFTDDCDGCGFCVRYCCYGVLRSFPETLIV